MNEEPKITKQQYIKLEQYHFNLVMFTITPEFNTLSDEKRNNIATELTYFDIALSVLSNVFVQQSGRLRKITAWTIEENTFGYNVLFEFSCSESASLILDIPEHFIISMCDNKSQYSQIKGYAFAYREDFETTIKSKF